MINFVALGNHHLVREGTVHVIGENARKLCRGSIFSTICRNDLGRPGESGERGDTSVLRERECWPVVVEVWNYCTRSCWEKKCVCLKRSIVNSATLYRSCKHFTKLLSVW